MKRLLLDTHVFLWAISADSRLSQQSRRLFESTGHQLLLSVGSLWEMLVKKQLGKLPVPSPAGAYLRRQLERNRITILNLAADHVYRLEEQCFAHGIGANEGAWILRGGGGAARADEACRNER